MMTNDDVMMMKGGKLNIINKQVFGIDHRLSKRGEGRVERGEGRGERGEGRGERGEGRGERGEGRGERGEGRGEGGGE